MTTIDTLNKTKIHFGDTFNSSAEIKKEISNILKIYQDCNRELIGDILKIQQKENLKKNVKILDATPDIKLVDINSENFKNETKSAEIGASEAYKFFCSAISKQKSFLFEMSSEFNTQIKSEKEIDVKKFPSLEKLKELEKEYNKSVVVYEKALIYGKDITIEIPSLLSPSLTPYFCYPNLTEEETKWLDGKTILFPHDNVKVKRLDGQIIEMPKFDFELKMHATYVNIENGQIKFQFQSDKEHIMKQMDSVLGKNKELAEKIKKECIPSVPLSLINYNKFAVISFDKTNVSKILKKQELIFESFKSFLTNQASTINHVYKLIGCYNEMIGKEIELGKKILVEVKKQQTPVQIQTESTPKDHVSQKRNKKNKDSILSKKEKIIQQNSQKGPTINETKPDLPVTYISDQSMYQIFLGLIGNNSSKISWNEAWQCCGKLGFTITPCGGSIVKFEYKNQLKALIPEKELEKFAEEITEEDFKVSKNIHQPHGKGKSSTDPMNHGLRSRFKLLLEETGFTTKNVLLKEEKTEKTTK